MLSPYRMLMQLDNANENFSCRNLGYGDDYISEQKPERWIQLLLVSDSNYVSSGGDSAETLLIRNTNLYNKRKAKQNISSKNI